MYIQSLLSSLYFENGSKLWKIAKYVFNCFEGLLF